jgi:ectoine hydroxylase-related dioxygenase (phytanoyl-CoA dioxygenase family)
MRRQVVTKQRQLTDEQLSDFKRDGFVVVRGMFDAAEMKRLARWTDEVEGYPETAGKFMMYFEKSLKNGSDRLLNRLENFYPYHDGFRALFDGAKLRGAVSELIGEDAVLFKDKINFKMPGGDGFKPHQDQQAGWSAYADFFVTALVSIDEATLENGCLELVAGYHDKGLVGEEWKPISDEQNAAMQPVAYPTKPGDVVFFDSYAPHGSGPNMTDRKRRVLYVTYNRRSDGDHRAQYYADKRASYPPDIERDPDKEYHFRV